MTQQEHSVDNLVLEVLRPYTYSDLIGCETANELAAILISFAPDSYRITDRLPLLSREENIALVTIVVPWVAGYLATHDVPPYLGKDEVAERGTTILKLLVEHPNYQPYASLIDSLPEDQLSKVILEYLGLQDPEQRLQYLRAHVSEVLNPGVDYRLAGMAYAAHRDGEYRLRDANMEFRRDIAKIRYDPEFRPY
jgi:hypothetical protein